jgi:hypothetical protein
VNSGGGLRLTSSAILRNSRVEGNETIGTTGTARIGGGVIMEGTSQVLNCSIQNNISVTSGGGISSANITTGGLGIIKNTYISGNKANTNGGGVAITGKTLIDSCSIVGNTAGIAGDGNGGGIYTNATASTEIKNSLISGNTASVKGNGVGGGIHTTLALVENCKIAGNIACDNTEDASKSGKSGGIYSHGGAILNCIIDGNRTIIEGKTSSATGNNAGGVNLGKHDTGRNLIANCLVINNHAQNSGGGITLDAVKSYNNTVCNNTAALNFSGGIYSSNNGVVIKNCIAWGNTGATRNDVWLNSYASISNSLFSGLQNEAGGNIEADPQFVDAPNGDFRLASSSPAINIGTADTTGLNIPALDLKASLRIVGGVIDLGAYEYFDDPTTVVLNNSESTLKIAVQRGEINVSSVSDDVLNVYTLSGTLHTSRLLSKGAVETIQLPAGLYVVKTGSAVEKVVVK